MAAPPPGAPEDAGDGRHYRGGMARHASGDVKARLADEIDRRSQLLLDVSHQIHAHPETLYEERFAHDLLAGVLEEGGLHVTRHAHGVETAFEATAGCGGRAVGVVCEFDALPGMGHACGHNIIAAAGAGAALAAAALADEVGGRVVVIGSPAEEGGGGKLPFITGGTVAQLDAALMVHPADADLLAMDVLAVHQAWVTYQGESAHAAAFPHQGRNALDAAVLGYVNVAALRQHVEPGERLHGVITHGGEKPNIVPGYARAEWMVRSPTLRGLDRLKERFVACIEAGARAAGCEVGVDWRDPVYADMVDNRAIGERYRTNAERLGRAVRAPTPAARVVGSTDMGNVSYEVPSIHPMIQVAPPGVAIHTPEFARVAAGPGGDRAVIDGAKALAWTVADLWLDPELVELARAEWATAVRHRTHAEPG